MANERSEIEGLLKLAEKVEAAGADAKAEALLSLVSDLERAERDPDLKVLVFTEFVPTQSMLAEYFEARGVSCACLNGSMSMDERQGVQTRFAKDARVLISTDAGGEGLNLQFCHVVVNFDIPWNPMRMEQRIGRVDRIGQKHPVRAFNFVFEDTVEYRVREVLEQKLSVIFEEFGVDKTSDVLDSAEAGHLFDSLYVEALLHPENLTAAVDRLTGTIRSQADQARQKSGLLQPEGLSPDVSTKLPIANWVERMVCHYLNGYGGTYEAELDRLSVMWPGATESQLFSLPGRERILGAELLSLEHPRVRALLGHLPRSAEGMPVPCLKLSGLPAGVAGCWSMWEIRLRGASATRTRLSPVFVHADGRSLQPTAKFLFERLMMEPWTCSGVTTGEDSRRAFRQSLEAARETLKSVYAELKTRHLTTVQQEEEKGEYSYRIRTRLLSEIGLNEVRDFRLKQLSREREAWRGQIAAQRDILPELNPLLILMVS